MIGTIRKHQKWLWAVIITAIIISFVWYFSPYSKMNAGRRLAVDLGTLDGRRISEEAFRGAYNEMCLRYFFSNGRWPADEGEREMERGALEWLLLIQKQEQFGIHISQDMVAEVARDMLHSFQRAGVSSPDALAQMLANRNLQLEDFERFVRHYLGVQELIATMGASGKLATPEELKGLYIREHQELAADAVFFYASNYLAGVAVAPEAIAQFYTNHQSDYHIPDRVQVSYIKFPVSNFWAQAEQFWAKTNLNDMVEANYQRFGTNYSKDAKTPEETKAKIKDDLFRNYALLAARKKAIEFAGPLVDFEEQHPDDPHPEAFAASAKTNGLTVTVTEPFDVDHEPKGLDVGEDFAPAAFKLTTNRPFAGPLVGRDGAYVIAANKTIPGEVPLLDLIRDRVVSDYKNDQARNLARQAGITFHLALTNSLTQGKAFDAVCADAKLKPVSLPPFSLSTRALPETEEQVSLNTLKQLAFSTAVGKASSFQWTSEGGLILFVKAKLPVEDAKLNKELPAFCSYVRQQRQTEAFNEWFMPEFNKSVHSRLLTRTDQQQPPPNPSSRPRKKS